VIDVPISRICEEGLTESIVAIIPLQVGRSLTLFRRRSLNLRHVVVRNGSRVALIPINGDSIPRRCDNRTKIGRRGPPANAVADLKKFRLIASH
jgi:hypothetical protein